MPPWICSASPRNRRVPQPPRPGPRPGAPVARPARRSAPRARAVADHLARPASIDPERARASAQRRSCDQWSPISWGERASICIRRAGTGARSRAGRWLPCCPRRSWMTICGASPAPAAIWAAVARDQRLRAAQPARPLRAGALLIRAILPGDLGAVQRDRADVHLGAALHHLARVDDVHQSMVRRVVDPPHRELRTPGSCAR